MKTSMFLFTCHTKTQEDLTRLFQLLKFSGRWTSKCNLCKNTLVLRCFVIGNIHLSCLYWDKGIGSVQLFGLSLTPLEDTSSIFNTAKYYYYVFCTKMAESIIRLKREETTWGSLPSVYDTLDQRLDDIHLSEVFAPRNTKPVCNNGFVLEHIPLQKLPSDYGICTKKPTILEQKRFSQDYDAKTNFETHIAKTNAINKMKTSTLVDDRGQISFKTRHIRLSFSPQNSCSCKIKSAAAILPPIEKRETNGQQLSKIDRPDWRPQGVTVLPEQNNQFLVYSASHQCMQLPKLRRPKSAVTPREMLHSNDGKSEKDYSLKPQSYSSNTGHKEETFFSIGGSCSVKVASSCLHRRENVLSQLKEKSKSDSNLFWYCKT